VLSSRRAVYPRGAYLKPAAALGGAIIVLGAFGCAHGRVSTAEAPKPPALRAPEDPTPRLIAEADAHMAAGLAEAKDGHLNRAREEFDRAVDVYLSAPGGAFSNPRLGEAYRRTLDEIHARELEALAAGDGFTEKLAEPASIDELADLTVPETPASEESRKAAEEVVGTEANDLPIELNDSVVACIELYQGRLKDWFTAALSRGGRYLPEIRRIFASEGIPQDLAYVALVESAFRTGAYSRAKAKGVWQFIASTGRRYGLQQDWWVDERSDPEKATRAAARYLKDLHVQFGDWNLALAAYNAGELVVERGISRYGVKDFWALARTRALRRETKSYVPLIHAAIVVAKAPEKYGFVIDPEPALTFDTVPVEGAVDLRVIAECAQTTIDTVQVLNPELRRLATPVNATFDLKVPEGSGGQLTDCLKSLPPARRVQFRTHVVARGQTLSSIAQRYSTETRAIAAANGLTLARRLPVGTELIIPIDARAQMAPTRPARTEASSEVVPKTRISYRIKPGDTLATIASQYGTTVRDLQAWNGLQTTRIAAGSTLTIYRFR
jgi:membrane-bound lytic murein transglycosylase D